MKRYKVTLIKTKVFYVEANSSDHAERKAFELDFEEKDDEVDTWENMIYNSIEVERLKD